MIWLASFPRSGNTFFRNVLHDVYGIKSSTYHKDPRRKVDPDYHAYDVVKTHLLPEELPKRFCNRPAVYIVRDGRDALVSLAHHRKDIVAPGTDFYNNLLDATLAQNGTFFGGWSENVNRWTERAAVVIRFEDLIQDPIREVEKLRGLLDLPQPNREKLPTFKSLREGRPVYGGGGEKRFRDGLIKKHFRKGKTGEWQHEFPAELLELAYRIHGPTLREMGYADVPPPRAPGDKKLVLIEGTKLLGQDNDGIKRYVASLHGNLTVLAPYYPELEIALFNGRDGSDIGDDDKQGVDSFETQSEIQSIVHDSGVMPYEKVLLLIKAGIRYVLPHRVYEAGARVYRRGPFRKNLTEVRTTANFNRAKSQMKKFRNRLGEAALVHLPLAQHFDVLPPVPGKLLLTVHDFSHAIHPEYHQEFNIEKAERGMQRAVEAGAYFLSVSEATQRDLIERHDPPAERLFVVPEAANQYRFKRAAGTEHFEATRVAYDIPDGPYLLCLSTIEPRKNIRRTIQAFLTLKEEHPELEASLVVCGKKGWKTDAIFAGLDLDRPDVVLTGFVDDFDLPAIYAHATALCYVSHYEGFGLPIVEAMACGTPVIYGDNSSQPEAAGPGGIGVDSRDTDAIGEAMYQLLTDESLRRKLGKAAWQHAMTFSWLKTALLTIEAYRTILNDEAA